TVSGREPLLPRLSGLVPVVRVRHSDKAGDVYGTITHNRARGTHLQEPMKAIVAEHLAEGETVAELRKETGMKQQEVRRLADFSREDFLARMSSSSDGYNRAEYHVKVK